MTVATVIRASLSFDSNCFGPVGVMSSTASRCRYQGFKMLVFLFNPSNGVFFDTLAA